MSATDHTQESVGSFFLRDSFLGDWLVTYHHVLCNQWHTSYLPSGRYSFQTTLCCPENHLQTFSHFLNSTKVITAPAVLSLLTFIFKLTAILYISFLHFLALLPPVKGIRPRSPPPPPPTISPEAKSPNSSPSSTKDIEQLEKGKDMKKVMKPTAFYENTEFHKKTASSVSATSLQTPSLRRTGTVNLAICMWTCKWSLVSLRKKRLFQTHSCTYELLEVAQSVHWAAQLEKSEVKRSQICPVGLQQPSHPITQCFQMQAHYNSLCSLL